MMRLVFKTNLDEAQADVHALNRTLDTRMHMGEAIPLPVPRIGERITFPFYRDGKRWSFDLAVCQVTYDYGETCVDVELHMPPHWASRSIAEWMKWFNKHRFGRE